MKKMLPVMILSAVTALWSAPSLADDVGGVASLRGLDDLARPRPADEMKKYPKDRAPLERDYLHQPPLIPHTIRGYEVSLSANKCLSCHSWKNYKKYGATKISMTHFETRDGQTLSDVSPRRYFCTQCHVPQADARPLVDNTFQPVEALKPE